MMVATISPRNFALASRRLAALAAVATIFLAAAILVFWLLVREQQTVRNDIREDALWASYQLDRETGKMLRAIDEARLSASPSQTDLLLQRFDILYSRVELMKAGHFPLFLI